MKLEYNIKTLEQYIDEQQSDYGIILLWYSILFVSTLIFIIYAITISSSFLISTLCIIELFILFIILLTSSKYFENDNLKLSMTYIDQYTDYKKDKISKIDKINKVIKDQE